MKKLIRAIIKIPATPFVVLICTLLLVILQCVKLYEWLYEATEDEKEITASLQVDFVNFLKQWFTTI
jgi:hypothetical protein